MICSREKFVCITCKWWHQVIRITKYCLSLNNVLEPEVWWKNKSEIRFLRENFHHVPESSPEKQYFALCFI